MNNSIGLHEESAKNRAQQLNVLLANYQLYYQNVRGFHWNIKGPQFFELHAKFELMYTHAQEMIDMIAERILTLGEHPKHSFTSYLETAQIKETVNVSTGKETVKTVLENLNVLLCMERQILKDAADAGDEGTATLMSDDIALQEKEVWMLGAYLG